MSGSADYSSLVEAVNFETVATGVLGVAAALMAVYIIIKGVKLMMGFVRGEGSAATGGGSDTGHRINVTAARPGYWDSHYQHSREDQDRIDRLMVDADMDKAERRY